MKEFDKREGKLNIRFRAGARKAHEKGKLALFRLLFGRTMVTLLLILLQIYFIYEVINRMQYSNVLKGIFDILGATAIIYIINSEENPAFKLILITKI